MLEKANILRRYYLNYQNKGIIPFIPAIGVWIQKVPNTGGMRGIIIGLAIGAIGMGIRTLIGRERGYLPE